MGTPSLDQLDPAWFAATQRELFTGQRLRVGSGRAVHAVRWVHWVGEHHLPAPACHTGWAGHGTHGDVRPTQHPVTCRRCLATTTSTHDQQSELLLF